MSKERAEVVVALDGSENSHRALLAAADLADAMGRPLGFLYVFPTRSTSGSSTAEDKESQSRAIFSAALAELGSRRRPVREHLLVGDPAAEILDFMEAHPNAHLVLGRRGLSKIKALLLGSVSDKVTRHSRGLVTVVS